MVCLPMRDHATGNAECQVERTANVELMKEASDFFQLPDVIGFHPLHENSIERSLKATSKRLQCARSFMPEPNIFTQHPVSNTAQHIDVCGTRPYAFEGVGKFEGDCIILVASRMAFRGVADALLDKIDNLHRINLSKAIQTLLNAVIQRRKPLNVVENVQIILGIGKLDSPSFWGISGPSQSHSYVS
jgi:hypothetical protein